MGGLQIADVVSRPAIINLGNTVTERDYQIIPVHTEGGIATGKMANVPGIASLGIYHFNPLRTIRLCYVCHLRMFVVGWLLLSDTAGGLPAQGENRFRMFCTRPDVRGAESGTWTPHRMRTGNGT